MPIYGPPIYRSETCGQPSINENWAGATNCKMSVNPNMVRPDSHGCPLVSTSRSSEPPRRPPACPHSSRAREQHAHQQKQKPPAPASEFVFFPHPHFKNIPEDTSSSICADPNSPNPEQPNGAEPSGFSNTTTTSSRNSSSSRESAGWLKKIGHLFKLAKVPTQHPVPAAIPAAVAASAANGNEDRDEEDYPKNDSTITYALHRRRALAA